MEHRKFKVGDKVRRTGDTTMGVIKGNIYTVSFMHERFDNIMKVEGIDRSFNTRNFELVCASGKFKCYICGEILDDIVTEFNFKLDIVIKPPDSSEVSSICYSCLKGIME